MRRKLLSATVGALLAAPAAPAAEVGLDDWDPGEVERNWRIGEVMDGSVYSSDNVRVGEVHDIIIGPEGLVDSVVVEHRNDEAADWRYYELDWTQVDFDPARGHVDVSMTNDEIRNLDRRDLPTFKEENEFEASDLLGMTANLDDDASYGEVTDLLISPTANDVEAFIVSSDGAGDLRYALPADFAGIDGDEQVLDLPYLVEDVEALALWIEPDLYPAVPE